MFLHPDSKARLFLSLVRLVSPLVGLGVTDKQWIKIMARYYLQSEDREAFEAAKIFHASAMEVLTNPAVEVADYIALHQRSCVHQLSMQILALGSDSVLRFSSVFDAAKGKKSLFGTFDALTKAKAAVLPK